MKDCIQIRIGKGLISLNEDRTRIAYVYQKKVRNVIHHMKCVHETAMLYFGGSAASSVYPHPITRTSNCHCHPRKSKCK